MIKKYLAEFVSTGSQVFMDKSKRPEKIITHGNVTSESWLIKLVTIYYLSLYLFNIIPIVTYL